MKYHKLCTMTLHLHEETRHLILVSVNGDRNRAAWLDKSVVSFQKDMREGRLFVVATIPEPLALETILI